MDVTQAGYLRKAGYLSSMEEGFEVVWIPSYGPEMRGGTAYCMVVMSDRPIGSLSLEIRCIWLP